MTDCRWLLREEAAEILGIQEHSVAKLFLSGRLTKRRKFDRTFAYDRAEVEAYATARHKGREYRVMHKPVYKGPRCTMCGIPSKARGLCCECYWHNVRGYARGMDSDWEPLWAWARGTFAIVNPGFHGVGG